MQQWEKYIVDKDTNMLCPIFSQTGELYTLVFRKADKLIVTKPPKQVVEDSLQLYGDSYQAARENACRLLKNKTIAPIVINAKKPIYLFPTHSDSRACNIWFSIDAIYNFEKFGDDMIKVDFYDGSSHLIEVSEKLFAHRYENACSYKVKRKQRKKCDTSKIVNITTNVKIKIDLKSDACIVFENAQKIIVRT